MSSSVSRTRKRSDTRPSLTSSVRTLPGVGRRREDLLRELGIETVGDLLVYGPRRYVDRTTFSSIADLKSGQTQSVTARVARLESRPGGRRRLFVLHAEDGTGKMKCVWFNQPYLSNVFHPGDVWVFSGDVKIDRFGTSMVHPEYEAAAAELLHTGRVVPIYSTRPGLSQKQIRTMVRGALGTYGDRVVDYLPEATRMKLSLVGMQTAIRHLHFPAGLDEAESARRRLAFDEVLLFQTLFAMARQERGSAATGRGSSQRVEHLLAHLPFTLTRGQADALHEILADIDDRFPMRRLLQGDVGCGKTAVAGLAAGVVCESGGQVALMCPTELLADQHYATLKRLMEPLGIRVGLLTGSMAADARQRVEAGVASGDLKMVVGTHALLTGRVTFKNLGLIVIDEEQRFGVIQRTRLVKKAPEANLLVITATPIPRTLALAAYGDLDITTIREMPPGRGRHRSTSCGEAARDSLLRRVAGNINRGLQGFYVCPALEAGEAGLMDVGTVKQRIGEHLAPGRPAEILTGRTPADERARIIASFRNNEIGILVATTVIEVGMDIPAATLLIVDQADRFGLSQLHQMRGRVARTAQDSFSYFVVSDTAGEGALDRVKVLVETFDGFEIAEKDLMLRGPGDLVGTRQHGMPDLKFARLPEDIDLMLAAREEAFERVLGGDETTAWSRWMAAVGDLTDGKISIV